VLAGPFGPILVFHVSIRRSRWLSRRAAPSAAFFMAATACSPAFANALLIRPAVMFGLDDAFLTTVLKLLRRLPIYPMFGRGLTRLQPAYVEDVAQAIAKALQRTETHAITYECGGPRVYSYEELLRAVAHEVGLKPMLIPIPFAAWHALAWFAEMLPSPPVTRNQVELMQINNVSSLEMPGFGKLGISPHSVEEILRETLWGTTAAATTSASVRRAIVMRSQAIDGRSASKCQRK
jgi:nucleoside-diphosphate-sugar epimerase